MGKRKKKRRIPFLISHPTAKMKKTAKPDLPNTDKGESAPDYVSIVDSGIRWLLVLAFVILILVAIEEISVVVFGRRPAENFTPTLISALTAIIGGILFFFRVLVNHYRNNRRNRDDQSGD